MKRLLKSLIVFFLVMVFSVSMLPTSVYAAQPDDIVAKAVAEAGNTDGTKYTFGAGYQAWCAYFVSWCARQAVIPTNVIPTSGSCDTLYSGLINNCGAIVVSAPVKGDIIFYRSHTTGGTFQHVGLMMSSTLSVQGNVSGKVYTNFSPYSYLYPSGSAATSGDIVYVRPKYQTATPGADSDSGSTLTSTRIAALHSDGTLYVKEGGLDATWICEATGVSQVVLSGNRIAALHSDGALYVKEGGLSATWICEATGVSQVALTGNRIAALHLDGTLYVKEGGLGATWICEATGVSQVALSGNRIAALHSDGTLYVKEGGLGATWIYEATGVSQVALSGNRIADLYSDGSLYVKEGGLSAIWVCEATGVSQVALSGNRIAALHSDGTLYVKEGGLGATWIYEATGVSQVALSGNRIAGIYSDGALYVKEGSLSAIWVCEATGVAVVSYYYISLPQAKAISSSYNSIKLTWNTISNASGYDVYRSTSSAGTYSKVATITNASYLDTGRTTGKAYYYKVKAYKSIATKKISYSKESAVVSAKAIPATPTTTLTKATSTSIKVAWSGVAGATKYQIYRATSSTGTYSLVYTASSTARSWVNTGRTVGKYYYYKVRAYHLEGTTKVYGRTSTVKYLKI